MHDMTWYIIELTLSKYLFDVESFFNNRMGRLLQDLGASGVGSKVWVLTIGVLEVNPEWDSIRAQRRRARSALFSLVVV